MATLSQMRTQHVTSIM